MNNYIMQLYDNALQYILDNGVRTSNRTGVDTLSVFGYQTRYRIDTHFPILTKRKMYYKSIFAELLWMISGSTNVKDLEARNSKVWSAWRDEKFEKQNGYSAGELGPIYGWALRHFGEDYNNRHNPKGFDQLSYMVNELKTNRTSRRILFTYWNPLDATSTKVRLPPCHHTLIVNVNRNGGLSGMLFQRSVDMVAGCPANIQFYSALLYMLAQQCGDDLYPYEFIHSTADTHIYIDQIDAVKEYLSREPVKSPQLKLNKQSSIFDYTVDDFIIENYNPLPFIKVPVAV